MNSQDEALIIEARRRVNDKIGFLIHLAAYVAVVTFLIILNLNTSSYFWAKWPAMGWGLGLVMHGLGISLSNGSSKFISPLKERMIQRELSKLS